MSNPSLTIIQGGKLLCLESGALTEHLSPFAQEKVAQEARDTSRHAWKTGDEAGNQHLFSRSQLWGGKGEAQPVRPPRFAWAQRQSSILWYVLNLSRTRGLFRFDVKAGQESRLFHHDGFDPHGLCLASDGGFFTTRTNADGAMHIVRLDETGSAKQVVTDGDCLDEFPCLNGNDLYYQTSGLGRNDQGFVCAQAATAVYRIDLTSGRTEVVAENPDFDYLLPRVDGAGACYYVRRPHLKPGETSFFTTLLDVVLFPYRVVVAILGFLDVFSRLFGQSPLKTAGGGSGTEMDVRHKLVLGRLVDLQTLAKSEGKPVAAPRDWVLLKRNPDGREEQLATNVSWFDLGPSGEVYHSNGFEIFGPDGRCHKADEIIESFACNR